MRRTILSSKFIAIKRSEWNKTLEFIVWTPKKPKASVLHAAFISIKIELGFNFFRKEINEKGPEKRLLILSPKQNNGDLAEIINLDNISFASKSFKRLEAFKFMNFTGKFELNFC